MRTLSLLTLLVLPLLLSPLALAGSTRLGVATAIDDPGHTGLSKWYTALQKASQGAGVARAIHYGDSTIAADGLARTVRNRLKTRFGDAGPGFVTAAFDGRWNKRSDVSAIKGGSWTYKTILLGGGGGRYGLGGIVSILWSGASVKVSAIKEAKTIVPQRRLEVWYQAGVGYGSIWAKADGSTVLQSSASAAATEDRRFSMDIPAGFYNMSVGSSGGAVPLYGLVMETGLPGITWEALGVIGVGSRSFSTYATQLPSQVRQRKPDLVVVMIGGNETGYASLTSNNGNGYMPMYEAGLNTILSGAPDTSCLVLSPLDQGYYKDGSAHSRPGMANMVARQRDVAFKHKCAFWSSWNAMGGTGSALRWASSGGLGAGDLVHLTGAGLDIIGNLLSDAILNDYDLWASGK